MGVDVGRIVLTERWGDFLQDIRLVYDVYGTECPLLMITARMRMNQEDERVVGMEGRPEATYLRATLNTSHVTFLHRSKTNIRTHKRPKPDDLKYLKHLSWVSQIEVDRPKIPHLHESISSSPSVQSQQRHPIIKNLRDHKEAKQRHTHVDGSPLSTLPVVQRKSCFKGSRIRTGGAVVVVAVQGGRIYT